MIVSAKLVTEVDSRLSSGPIADAGSGMPINMVV